MNKMKKDTLKIFKKTSRKAIPHSLLRCRIIPSRKRKLQEKALKRALFEYLD